MSTNASDKGGPRPEADEIQTVAGGPDRLPGALTDVIKPEGAAEPGSAAAMPQVVAWLFQEATEAREISMDEVADLAADDESFVWIDLSDYDPADIEDVAGRLELPKAAVRTALAGWQRPQLGVFGERFFVSVTVPRVDPDGGRLLAGELDLFVGRNYLVSAHKQPLPFADRVMVRAAQNPDLLKLDSAFLLSILIDELLVHYEELTEGLEDDIETMEERALRDTSDAFLEDLLQFKRFVFAVYRLASQHRAIAEAFLRPDFPLVEGELVEPYFRDLESRLGRLLDGLESAKETVNGAFDIYVSQVGHRTNDIMKVLAIVSAVLLPATVIIGFFSTGFEEPPLTTPAGFVAMTALMIMSTAGAVYLFNRWGWLASPTTDRSGGTRHHGAHADRGGETRGES